jgi:hypothetical protein
MLSIAWLLLFYCRFIVVMNNIFVSSSSCYIFFVWWLIYFVLPVPESLFLKGDGEEKVQFILCFNVFQLSSYSVVYFMC